MSACDVLLSFAGYIAVKLDKGEANVNCAVG